MPCQTKCWLTIPLSFEITKHLRQLDLLDWPGQGSTSNIGRQELIRFLFIGYSLFTIAHSHLPCRPVQLSSITTEGGIFGLFTTSPSQQIILDSLIFPASLLPAARLCILLICLSQQIV